MGETRYKQDPGGPMGVCPFPVGSRNAHAWHDGYFMAMRGARSKANG
jgi:hypothetical protein